MRSMILTALAALALSPILLSQNAQPALPKCLQDAPPVNVDFKDVSVAKVLPFLGASCGIDIRVEGIEGTDPARAVPRVQFQQARPAEVFLMLIRANGLKYTVVDEKTIRVT